MVESTYVAVLVGNYITAYYFKMVEGTYVGILVGYYITAYYFKMVETHMWGSLLALTSQHTILKW